MAFFIIFSGKIEICEESVFFLSKCQEIGKNISNLIEMQYTYQYILNNYKHEG